MSFEDLDKEFGDCKNNPDDEAELSKCFTTTTKHYNSIEATCLMEYGQSIS